MTLPVPRIAAPILLVGLVGLLPSCGDSETSSPAPVPQSDAALDSPADTGADVQLETGPDAAPDTPEDSPQDAAEDVIDGGSDAPDAATPTAVCSSDGWCWSNPTPQGNSLWGIMGGWASDVWAVGQHGTILRWNGSFWSSTPSGTTSWLTGLWVTSSGGAFASGENAELLRWDGAAWGPLSCQLSEPAWFDDVWAAGPDDLWMTAGTRVVHRTNGECDVAWTGTSLQTVVEVWGSGPTDVWAVGWEWDDVAGRDFGLTIHWDGAEWTETRHETSDRLYAIHGTADDDIWVMAAGTDPLRWDGQSWTHYPVPAVSTYEGVWGNAPGDYWAVGTGGIVVHWDGVSWTQVDSGTEAAVMGVWAATGGPIFAAGEAGLLLESSAGSSFERRDLAVPPESPLFASAWADGSGRVWVAGGYGAVVRSVGDTWESMPTGCASVLHGIAGSAETDVWVAGEDGVVCRYDGVEWKQVTTSSSDPLMGIWVSHAGEAWAVGGYSAVLHGTAAGMQAVDVGVQQNFTAVWGFGPEDLWIAGTNDTLLHWDGAAWEQAALDPVNGPVSVVRALYGASSDDIWAATTEGLLRWDGSVWHRVEGVGLTEATALWGTSGSKIYAVGLGGWAAYWDGATWERQSTGTTNDLFGLVGAGAGVYAVGDRGTILVRE